MYRKLIMSLTPLLAVTAFAVIPAVAQALPRWEHCVKGKATEEFKDSKCSVKAAGGGFIQQLIPEGKANAEQVKTHGRLELFVEALGQKIKCFTTDAGHVWNEGGVGKDEITKFVNTQCITEPKCSPVAVVAEKLPWQTELFEEAGVIHDRVTGIQVKVACGVILTPFSGTLTPLISTTNGSATFNKTTGFLKNPEGVPGEVTGVDEVEQEAGGAIRAHK